MGTKTQSTSIDTTPTMKLLQETTSTFAVNQRHTYLVSNDRFMLHGYIPHNQTQIIHFTVPKSFQARDRTFKEIKQ